MKRSFNAVLAVAVLVCLVPVTGQAITPYSQNFEGLIQSDIAALANDGLLPFYLSGGSPDEAAISLLEHLEDGKVQMPVPILRGAEIHTFRRNNITFIIGQLNWHFFGRSAHLESIQSMIVVGRPIAVFLIL